MKASRGKWHIIYKGTIIHDSWFLIRNHEGQKTPNTLKCWNKKNCQLRILNSARIFFKESRIIKDISEARKLKELNTHRLILRVMLKEFFTLKKIMSWIIILLLSSLKYVRLSKANVITLFTGVFNVCRYMKHMTTPT